MRIGIVTEYYRPWPGGISEHVHHEACGLRDRGHQVTIVTGPARWEGSAPASPAAEEGVLRIGRELRFTSNGAASRMVLGTELLRLRRRFRALGLDVVHVHAPLDPFLAWAAVAASPCATVGTFHASFRPSGLWDGLFRWARPITGRLFAKLDARIAVSPEARRSIEAYFEGDYTIVPNGVDLERFRPGLPPIPALSDGRPSVLFVGRADPRKGLPCLLEALPSLKARVPDVRLVVVGVARAELEALWRGAASGLGGAADLEKDVHCAGYVAPEELPRYFADCDLFCSPATGQESQGIVLLEAMASGTPPVAFTIDGYRDVIHHGRDGWLVPEMSASSLADALCGLLLDPARRQRLGDAARENALRYAWPRVVERIEAVFEQAVEGRARRGPV